MVDREILVYGTNEYTYNFKYFRTRNTLVETFITVKLL